MWLTLFSRRPCSEDKWAKRMSSPSITGILMNGFFGLDCAHTGIVKQANNQPVLRRLGPPRHSSRKVYRARIGALRGLQRNILSLFCPRPTFYTIEPTAATLWHSIE